MMLYFNKMTNSQFIREMLVQFRIIVIEPFYQIFAMSKLSFARNQRSIAKSLFGLTKRRMSTVTEEAAVTGAGPKSHQVSISFIKAICSKKLCRFMYKKISTSVKLSSFFSIFTIINDWVNLEPDFRERKQIRSF